MELLRTLLPGKTASSAPDTINCKGLTISDPAIIADKFNHYFANISTSLAQGLNDDTHDFLEYLNSPCFSFMYLNPTSPQEILRLFNYLNFYKLVDMMTLHHLF